MEQKPFKYNVLQNNKVLDFWLNLRKPFEAVFLWILSLFWHLNGCISFTFLLWRSKSFLLWRSKSKTLIIIHTCPQDLAWILNVVTYCLNAKRSCSKNVEKLNWKIWEKKSWKMKSLLTQLQCSLKSWKRRLQIRPSLERSWRDTFLQVFRIRKIYIKN